MDWIRMNFITHLSSTKRLSLAITVAAVFFAFSSCEHEPQDISELRDICFDTEVLPIFTSNCAISGCHNAGSAEEGFVLDTYENIVRKGIRPGNSKDSELYTVLFASGEDQMPPSGIIPEAQRTLIRLWIDQGANNKLCGDGAPEVTGVCFETEVLPLIVSNCAIPGCHDAQTHEEGLNFTTYAGIKKAVRAGNPGDSELYETIVENDPDDIMPPSPYDPLSSQQIAKIYDWIREGAKETTCDNCDTTQFDYTAAISPIVVNYCKGCHSGNAPSGSISLETYDDVKTIADNGQLAGVLTGEPGYSVMPPAGKLQDCQIEQVKNWIAANAPNN